MAGQRGGGFKDENADVHREGGRRQQQGETIGAGPVHLPSCASPGPSAQQTGGKAGQGRVHTPPYALAPSASDNPLLNQRCS